MRNRLEMGATATSDAGKDRCCPCYTLKIRGGCETYVRRDGKKGTAGKGPLVQCDVSATLGTTQDQYLFVRRGDGEV